MFRTPVRQQQKVKQMPPPIGGVNARDAIVAMPELDAVSLTNWIPDTYGVRSRKGYREWAINFPSSNAVEAVFGYVAPTTTIPGGSYLTIPTAMPGKFFAATKAGIYDITNSTNAPTLSQALSGNDNAGWFSHTMLTNAAGTFLLAVSEVDGYWKYDGAAWAKPVAGAGAGQINGANPDDFCFVTMFKKRVWFVQRNTTKAWYLPVDSFAGTVAQLDFGSQFKRGGSLAYLANWTIDAGEGVDDFLVAVSTNGDVVVYKGTDPATDFAIVGTWNVGQIPVGRRGFVQYGGDLIIASADGLFPMSYVTRGGASMLQASGKEYTSKIRATIGKDLRNSFTNRGWDFAVHPAERVMLANVPNYGPRRNFQYAMSTALNEWCYFQDIPTYCYGSSVGYTFAGTQDGRVLLLLNGYFDNVAYGASTGNGIAGAIIPAFSVMDAPTVEKQFLMVRPTFLSVDQPGFQLDINVNYSIQDPTGSPAYFASTQSLWDTDLWDTAMWSGQQSVYSEWASVEGMGFSGAATFVTNVVADTTLVSIDYMFTQGGPL